MAKQVKFDEVVFNDSINRLARVYGKSKKAVANQQAGLILRDCIRFTPPYRGGVFKDESGGRFSIGKNAITKQVDKIFRGIESLDIVHQKSRFSDELLENLRAGNYQFASQMMHKATGKFFNFAASPSREYHFKHIDRDGRARRSQGVLFIGKEKGKNSLRTYYRKLWSRVMRGVGGWATAAKELGVKMPGRALKVAKWRGDAIQKRDSWNYSITCKNDVPYLNNNKRAAEIVQRSLNNRMRKIRLELRAASKAVAAKMNQALKTGRIPTERQVAEALKHTATENPF